MLDVFFSYLKFLPADLGVTDHPVCFGQVVLSTIQVEVPQIFTDLEDYSWYVEKSSSSTFFCLFAE